MVLPGNRLHAILTLPEGDTRYSARWGWIKKEFTKAYLAVGGNEGFPFKARLSLPGCSRDSDNSRGCDAGFVLRIFFLFPIA